MQFTILLTRPEDASLQFADQLRQRFGCRVRIVISPLIRIQHCGRLPDLSQITHLIFTSRNGVSAYCDAENQRNLPCYAVGGATTEAARQAGLRAISADGSADDLVDRIVQDGIKGPCLHVRGEHGVGEVADRLSDAGIPTQEAILYRQAPLQPSNEAADLLRGSDPVFLPIFSPRTARLLFSAITPEAPVRVLALSDNVAKAVPGDFQTSVVVAEKPDAATMLDTIADVVAGGKSLEGGKRAQ